eukprot:6181119-Pleurochrysis_carterae.AAC.1
MRAGRGKHREQEGASGKQRTRRNIEVENKDGWHGARSKWAICEKERPRHRCCGHFIMGSDQSIE